jgi:hypothetical protein
MINEPFLSAWTRRHGYPDITIWVEIPWRMLTANRYMRLILDERYAIWGWDNLGYAPCTFYARGLDKREIGFRTLEDWTLFRLMFADDLTRV